MKAIDKALEIVVYIFAIVFAFMGLTKLAIILIAFNLILRKEVSRLKN
jgi:hypothetical protein